MHQGPHLSCLPAPTTNAALVGALRADAAAEKMEKGVRLAERIGLSPRHNCRRRREAAGGRLHLHPCTPSESRRGRLGPTRFFFRSDMRIHGMALKGIHRWA